MELLEVSELTFITLQFWGLGGFFFCHRDVFVHKNNPLITELEIVDVCIYIYNMNIYIYINIQCILFFRRIQKEM